MANFDTTNPMYNAVMRKLETTDPAHADLFNSLFGQLLNNDVFTNSKVSELKDSISTLLTTAVNKDITDKVTWNNGYEKRKLYLAGNLVMFSCEYSTNTGYVKTIATIPQAYWPPNGAKLNCIPGSRADGKKYFDATINHLNGNVDVEVYGEDGNNAGTSGTITVEGYYFLSANSQPGLSALWENILLDDTLTVEGQAADAGAVGNVIGQVNNKIDGKVNINQGVENAGKVLVIGEEGSIKSEVIEQKYLSPELIEKIENVGSKWIELENGEEFYYKAPLAIIGITAVITDSSTVFYDSMTLDAIKKYLTVTAFYNDDTQAMVTDYTISGSITVGTCSMTVTYMGHKAAVDIEVQERIAIPERITAACTENTINIYTELEDLRQYLTVTLHYNDGEQEAVTDYALSGTLQTGASTITVTYQDFTTTFTVTGIDSGGYTTNNITVMYDFSKYEDLHTGEVLDEINSYPADCGALEIVTNNSDKGGIRGGFFVPARRYMSGVMQSAYLNIPYECQVGIYPFSVEIYGRIRGQYNDYNSSPGIIDLSSNNAFIFTSRQDQNKNNLMGYILNAFVSQDRQYLSFDGNASQPNLITKDIDIPYANAAQNIKTLSHIVCCADATAQKVYFNGVLIKEDTKKGVGLGGCEKATLKFDNYFDIGVVRVYSRMLTNKEVLRNYNDCVTRIGREMP